MRKIPVFDLCVGSFGQKIHIMERGRIKVKKSACLKKPKHIYHFAKNHLYKDSPAEEYAYLICTNTALFPIAVSQISHGTNMLTPIGIREVLTRALLMGASAFIIVHNHVSGDTTPSPEDRMTTLQIREAGMIIGIPLKAHIIVAGDRFAAVSPSEISRDNINLQTLTLDMRTLFAAYGYEMGSFSYDLGEGILRMEMPDGKWQLHLQRLPDDSKI